MYNVTQMVYSIPLLYAVMGADITSVSMVLCDLLERASFYFKKHRGEHTSITFYKLPIKKKYPQPNTRVGRLHALPVKTGRHTLFHCRRQLISLW